MKASYIPTDYIILQTLSETISRVAPAKAANGTAIGAVPGTTAETTGPTKGAIFPTTLSAFFQNPGFSTSCCLSRVSAMFFAALLLLWFVYQSIQPFHYSSFYPVELAQASHLTLRSTHPVEPSFLHRVFHSTL